MKIHNLNYIRQELYREGANIIGNLNLYVFQKKSFVAPQTL